MGHPSDMHLLQAADHTAAVALQRPALRREGPPRLLPRTRGQRSPVRTLRNRVAQPTGHRYNLDTWPKKLQLSQRRLGQNSWPQARPTPRRNCRTLSKPLISAAAHKSQISILQMSFSTATTRSAKDGGTLNTSSDRYAPATGKAGTRSSFTTDAGTVGTPAGYSPCNCCGPEERRARP
jgi:hypothetical protein